MKIRLIVSALLLATISEAKVTLASGLGVAASVTTIAVNIKTIVHRTKQAGGVVKHAAKKVTGR